MKPIAAFFISSLLVGQVPTSLNFGSPAVSPPIPSATKVGATGFTNTFYWVVARTPGGYSSPGAAIATNTVGSANFSVSNYVVISWPAISGATGYDVIRSDSPSYPASTSCASCAVALNQAGTSFSDQGGATSAYSGGAQSVASQAIFTLDNVTVATPQVNVQILNSRQNVTFALPSSGVGTVTSVGMTVPGALLSVSGSPITTSGTLAVSLVTQSANCVFAGPTSGGAATPTCRALVSADLPAGVGTVTSVGLSLPGIFTVSGSPVTTTGTLTGTLATQTANTIWAGPTTGAAAAPTFRALVAADMPAGVIPTGNAVGGASNLTTVGAVPYVSASGVLNQDASNFFWDATNHRLGIGTNAPNGPLQVTGAASSMIVVNKTDATARFGRFGQGGVSTLFDFDNLFSILPGSTISGAFGQYTALSVNTSRQVRIGYMDLLATDFAGTLKVYDATASTGATTLTVKAGAGQSTTNLQEWQNNAGTVLSGFAPGGDLFFTSSTSSSDVRISRVAVGTATAMAAILRGDAGDYGRLYLKSMQAQATTGIAGLIGWGSAPGTYTTALSEVGAGIVGVGTGSAGSVAGTLQATNITLTAGGEYQWSGRARIQSNGSSVITLLDVNGTNFDMLKFGSSNSASFPGLKRSTTGLIARLADDSADTWVKTLYVQTNVVAVASLPACNAGLEGSHYGVNNALAPTALATVVGGGAVHVSVYCDGTNWIVN